MSLTIGVAFVSAAYVMLVKMLSGVAIAATWSLLGDVGVNVGLGAALGAVGAALAAAAAAIGPYDLPVPAITVAVPCVGRRVCGTHSG